MRYRELDSVRGFAAFAVLLHHCALATPEIGETALSHLGPSSVLLFFFLSGFVLTLSLGSRPPYFSFSTSRFIRIWLPFSVVTLISALLGLQLKTWPQFGTQWIAGTWNSQITLGLIVRHLLMTGTNIDLNNPMWSLIHELRISLILPALLILTRRFPALTNSLAVLVSFIAIWLVGYSGISHIMGSLVATGTYIWLFTLGIWLALNAQRVKTVVCGISPISAAALWLLALVAMMASPTNTAHVTTVSGGLETIVAGVGGAMIVILAIGRENRLLRNSVSQWLGRVSYSLYLTHVVVIATLFHLLGDSLPPQIIGGAAVVVALVTAEVTYRSLEAPSHRLAKVLSSRSAIWRRNANYACETRSGEP